MILKKVGILSLGYVVAIFSFIMGIVQTIMIIIQIKTPLLASQFDSSVLEALNENLIKVIFVTPLTALIIGFIAGILSALIYNYIVVKLTGGLKVELK